MQHVISVNDLGDEFIGTVFKRATYLKQQQTRGVPTLRDKLLITDFFEPSTRTRLSFEAAMSYMGGMVIGTENAAEFSSFKKGESLSDSFRVISGYCDIIVGRFLHEGEAGIAAEASMVPVINGGDGKGEHPSQSMIDLFSIIEHFPEPDDLKITFIGDNLHSRTVQSLARLLARFPAVTHMTFVGPPNQSYHIDDQDGFLHSLRQIAIDSGRSDGSLGFLCTHALSEKVMKEFTDVAYVTRSQTERHTTYKGTSVLKPNGGFPDIVLTPDLANLMPESSIILHPLPRNSELPSSIDKNHRAYYFQQAHNGLYVRMALLEALCLNAN